MKRSEYIGKIDAHRPLATKGRNQSRALVSLLDAFGITAVHSSDSTRCIETVEAYAQLLGTKVLLEKALSEEAHREHPLRAARSVRRIIESPQASVICSHRPVMATIMASVADSLGLTAADPRLDPKLSLGAFVVIHRAFTEGKIRAVAIERHDAPLSDGEDHDLLG
jgi:8-oxo-dGTP diphosphatase